MNINVEMKGLQKAIKDIKMYELTKQEGVKQIVAKTALLVESEAVSRAPVDTGNLKNSMLVNFYKGGTSAEISNSALYAPYVEFGTKRMVSQPFLFPAWEASRPDYIESLKRELGRT